MLVVFLCFPDESWQILQQVKFWQKKTSDTQISPKPRTRWWRQVHKEWKRKNTLRHRVRESHLRTQAEEPLGSLCVLPLKETHRGDFGLTGAQLMWQRRLWGQNPNASKRGKLTVSSWLLWQVIVIVNSNSELTLWSWVQVVLGSSGQHSSLQWLWIPHRSHRRLLLPQKWGDHRGWSQWGAPQPWGQLQGDSSGHLPAAGPGWGRLISSINHLNQGQWGE